MNLKDEQEIATNELRVDEETIKSEEEKETVSMMKPNIEHDALVESSAESTSPSEEVISKPVEVADVSIDTVTTAVMVDENNKVVVAETIIIDQVDSSPAKPQVDASACDEIKSEIEAVEVVKKTNEVVIVEEQQKPPEQQPSTNIAHVSLLFIVLHNPYVRGNNYHQSE